MSYNDDNEWEDDDDWDDDWESPFWWEDEDEPSGVDADFDTIEKEDDDADL